MSEKEDSVELHLVFGWNYTVKYDGTIRNNGIEIPHEMINDEPHVRLDWLFGDKYYRVADIVGHAFKPMRCDYSQFEQFKCVKVDEGLPLSPTNLVWKLKNGPVESIRAKDFFIIPGYTAYAINKDGVLISNITGRVREFFKDSGYYKTRINPDNTKEMMTSRHRLMAMAFIPYEGDINKLVINHLNGVPGDDRIENLEWCSRARNNTHAVETGIKFKKYTILARNVHTGEVSSFKSYGQLARSLGLNTATVHTRVKTPGQPVYYPGQQYQFEETLTEWRIPSKEEIERVMNKGLNTGEKRLINAINLSTGEEREVLGYSELAALTGVSRRTLMADLSGELNHKPRNGWDFHYLD